MMAPAGFEHLDGLRSREGAVGRDPRPSRSTLRAAQTTLGVLRAPFGRGRSAGRCAGATCPAALLQP